jgi:HlyD family secretion protein
MSTRAVWLVAGAGTIAASVMALGRSESPVAAPVGEVVAAGPPDRIVGPGRVEPISEEIEIGIEVGGRIVALHVDDGDVVAKGQPIAELEGRDYRARLAAADASLADARAVLLRTRNGSRPEERREAQAAVEQAEAVLEQADREAARRAALLEAGAVPREDRDRAVRDLAVARARVAELRERLALVDAGPRAEDHARAEAEVASALAARAEAHARLEKTMIRSPIDGTVLRRRVRVGESVSPEVPGQTLFTLADISRLRVRVDVDENDVGQLRVGQTAYVTAATFGDRRFPGRVVKIGRVLGRKNIRTDEPRERVDTKILEVLVELEPGTELPIGLRVDATILR